MSKRARAVFAFAGLFCALPTLTLGDQNRAEIGEKANDFVNGFSKTKKTC